MTVTLVSGATRGIGREICRQLAAQGHSVLLGARDLERGRTVAAELEGDVTAVQLDVTDQASVDALASSLDRLDVLVNNAGLLLDGWEPALEPDWEKIRTTLETNLFGAYRLTVAMVPILRRSENPRIVNVSSGMGGLTEMGGTTPGYRLSKAALNVVTRMVAKEFPEARVNSACPGFVQTDMGGENAPKTVEEGADTPVWLATLPPDGPSGGFFRNRQPIAF